MSLVEPVVLISAIEHHAYCPRQCALVHVDGMWADNQHTVKGTRMHRRADSGQHRMERGRQVLRSIPLWSERLGLAGRADVIEIEGTSVWPVEYKSGSRHGDAADLQVCAQALCLEEMFETEIDYGYVWFGANRRRVKVHFDDPMRSKTYEAIAAIRLSIRSGALPSAPNDARCVECQLQQHCLPSVVDADPDDFEAAANRRLFG